MTPSSAKLRIGIVTWDFVPSKGGMGRSMEWMAESLSESFSVFVGTPGGRLSALRFWLSPLLSFTAFFGGHVLFSLYLPFVLQRWIRKNNIDVLLIPGGPGGVFLIRKPKIPYIVSTYHVYEQQARLVPGQWWKRIFVPLEARTYRRSAGVLSFNQDASMILQKTYHIPSDRLHLLPHAIDVPVWMKSVHSRVRGLCVCVARLEARKGVDVLLHAWSDVLHQCPDAKLVIVGRGVLASYIDRLIRHTPSVRRYAELSHADLVALIQRAEIAVSPSYLEGFGLAIAEAMVAGTAVVASNSEGVRCLIEDGKTGFLFTSGDEKALADAMIKALGNDAMRQKIAHAALKEAEKRFDPDTASHQLRQTLQEIVTQRR